MKHHTYLSDSISKKASESAAEIEVLTKTTVVIPSEKWEEFQLWMNGPPKVIPELKELLNMKPIWELET